MAISNLHYETFKRGSKTYFNSSVFFPKSVREDVFILYGFVRTADDFVDKLPVSDAEGFYKFKDRYYRALGGEQTGDPIIDDYLELVKRKGFDPEWTDAFLKSMEMDLRKSEYDSLEETLEYIYGSAEVIGLFMAKILDLPADSYHHAKMLGRAMQFINFIRDIDEDVGLGRRYIPLSPTNLKKLDKKTALEAPDEFRKLVRHYLGQYKEWQDEAEQGYRYIPKRYLIPIKTAGDMYNWTARQIEADPFVVFKRKVKPPKQRIVLQGVKNFFTSPRRIAEKRMEVSA